MSDSEKPVEEVADTEQQQEQPVEADEAEAAAPPVEVDTRKTNEPPPPPPAVSAWGKPLVKRPEPEVRAPSPPSTCSGCCPRDFATPPTYYHFMLDSATLVDNGRRSAGRPHGLPAASLLVVCQIRWCCIQRGAGRTPVCVRAPELQGRTPKIGTCWCCVMSSICWNPIPVFDFLDQAACRLLVPKRPALEVIV
jgi:hypothetical protein